MGKRLRAIRGWAAKSIAERDRGGKLSWKKCVAR
jgi:hypothetical protein